MNSNRSSKWFFLFCLMFPILGLTSNVVINPQLLKDDPEIRQLVYFGMSLEEFQEKLVKRSVDCNPTPDKKIGDTACTINIHFAISEIQSAIGVFKEDRMVAFVTRVESEKYSSIIAEFQTALGTQPRVETKIVDKGFFSKKIDNEYTTWSNQNYKLMVSKFDIPRYKENGNNFSVIYESISSKETELDKANDERKAPKVLSVNELILNYARYETKFIPISGFFIFDQNHSVLLHSQTNLNRVNVYTFNLSEKDMLRVMECTLGCNLKFEARVDIYDHRYKYRIGAVRLLN